ncbi:MAG: hypothetical protein AAGJ87_11085 [Pseudomonadota bacterium]
MKRAFKVFAVSVFAFSTAAISSSVLAGEGEGCQRGTPICQIIPLWPGCDCG